MGDSPPPDGAPAALKGLAHGAGAAAGELIDVLFSWIVPIIMVIIGFLMSPAIGLSGAFGTLIDGVLGPVGLSSKVMGVIASVIAVLVWGVIGGAMWHFGSKYDGQWASYVLKPIAGLFIGFALGEVPGAFDGKVANGALGQLASPSALVK